MSDRINVHGLQVEPVLYDFINNEALPGSGVDQEAFWSGAAGVINDLAPRNRELLAIRDDLQAKIDQWHRDHPGAVDFPAYKAFLTEIGYLVDVPEDFQISTSGVDSEIAETAGPQLVVPILNARFALNAANARWGSLYDALYGTDVIPETDGAEKARRIQQGPRRQGHRLRQTSWTRPFRSVGQLRRRDRSRDRRRRAAGQPR